MKICNKCEIKKVNSEFYKHRFTKDGLQQPCKSCKSNIHRNINRHLPPATKSHETNRSVAVWRDIANELKKCRIDLQNKEAELKSYSATLGEKEHEINQLNEQLLDCRKYIKDINNPLNELFDYRIQDLMDTLHVTNELVSKIVEGTVTTNIEVKSKKNIWKKLFRGGE